jgi:phosphate transport system substrate-binding protein
MKRLLLSLTLVLSLAASAQTAVTADPKLPDYKVQSGVSGNLNSIGSDTLNNLMTFWAESFRKLYPNVKVQIEGKGSSTAPPALIAGTAQLGPMSREMKAAELDGFEKKFGYKPRAVAVALDGLAVFVNKDNPVKSLTLEQADAIFSATRKRGAEAITTWGQVGLTGEWANRPVSLYGRNSASGTYGYFKEHVLKGGDYSASVKEQPGSASVVQGIEKELGGIGYSGIGYATSGVRALPIADKGAPIDPNYENVESFKYPIARYLYVYINVPPAGADKLTCEFIKFVISKAGQADTVKDGYFPLSVKASAKSLADSGCK